ncbi:MAG: ubiquinol-cytochrome C chaperone family protein [Bosea sp. (in: a-proteobacteria)]
MLSWLRRKPKADPVADLHGRVVAAALAPALYAHGGLADSFEGRFESLTLHVFLVMRRLKSLASPGPELSQELVDRTFTGLDHTLRQIGISDTAIPKRMKELASGFLGRVRAYEEALASNDRAALSATLLRNALGSGDGDLLTDYVLAADAHLASLDLDALMVDQAIFPRLVMDEAGV